MLYYLEVLCGDLERDEDVCGEGDVPELDVVVGEPRPPVHRLVQRSVRRVVLRLREGALLSLKGNSACLIKNFHQEKFMFATIAWIYILAW